MTDAGLEAIEPLARLDELHLTLTNVTDEGLLHLKSLPNLELLDLSSTKVTDVGLEQLSADKTQMGECCWYRSH